MARMSDGAKARLEEQKKLLDVELAKYQKLVYDLRTSNESSITKTHKQKEYHKKIQDVQHKIMMLNAK